MLKFPALIISSFLRTQNINNKGALRAPLLLFVSCRPTVAWHYFLMTLRISVP